MNRTWYNSLLMYAWLTLGFAAVHVAICSWMIAIWVAAWPSAVPYEHLQFDAEGEPLIQVWTPGVGEVLFRRLDGTPVPNSQHVRRNFLTPAHFSSRPVGEPATWEQRIGSYSDFQSPTSYWYHVEPSGHSGTSYFEGFDKATRRPIGFIGVAGFLADRPNPEQSFRIRTSSLPAQSGLLTATQVGYYQVMEPYNNSLVDCENAFTDSIWLLSVDTIFEIRLSTRTVRPLPKKFPDSRYLTHASVMREGNPYYQLLVRTDSGMQILDPETMNTETLALDPMSPSASYYEQFYQEKSGRRILVRSSYEPTATGSPRNFDITWLGKQGEVVRQVETTLQNPGNRMPLIALPICLPVPIACYGTWFVAPQLLSEHSKERATYLQQVGAFAAQMWMWLSSSLVAGIISGWGCRNREREIFGRTGLSWPILGGICGWFGWVGYIFLNPLPARLPNGEWIPARPEPSLPLGIEIYA